MFSVGEAVIYGTHGVCKITGTQDMTIEHQSRPYYVLQPVFEDRSTFYLPIGNKEVEAKMHRVLSAEEICALIKEMPDEDTIWIENDRERKEQYKKILLGDDRPALVKLIKTLWLRQQELEGKGRKLRATDERLLKDAEDTLSDEFAHVLNIKREEVLPFIYEQIEANGK